jgi:hypothetical protein
VTYYNPQRNPFSELPTDLRTVPVYHRNPDYEIQRLQRLAATGDIDAAAKLLSWRMRLGLNPYSVRQAAALGDPASLMLVEPAPLVDKHCNYPAASRGEFSAIGFNIVDGVLGGLQGMRSLTQVGIELIQHALTSRSWYVWCAGWLAILKSIESLLILVSQAEHTKSSHNIHLDQLYSLWADESREEFYEKFEIKKIQDRHTRQLNEIYSKIREQDQLLRGASLPGGSAESEIRWAAVNLARLENSSLTLVWIAVHCRMAAGDGSEAHQRQELEWQRQFLIRWLLN